MDNAKSTNIQAYRVNRRGLGAEAVRHCSAGGDPVVTRVSRGANVSSWIECRTGEAPSDLVVCSGCLPKNGGGGVVPLTITLRLANCIQGVDHHFRGCNFVSPVPVLNQEGQKAKATAVDAVGVSWRGERALAIWIRQSLVRGNRYQQVERSAVAGGSCWASVSLGGEKERIWDRIEIHNQGGGGDCRLAIIITPGLRCLFVVSRTGLLRL